MTDRIVTDRIALRPPAPEDWPAWHAFHTSPRSRFVGGGDKPVFDIFRAFSSILGHWQFRGWDIWVVDHPGEDTTCGMVGPHYPVGWPEPEIGWTIWTDALEGTGLAREAAEAARADAFRRLGWTTAVSDIDNDNDGSWRLAERLGARIDPDAAHPGSYPLLVYRHPSPESLR